MENQKNKVSNDGISIKEMIQIGKNWWNYLFGKWIIILFFGLVGAGLGVLTSFFVPTKYTAQLSFALVEKSGEMSGLADLASTFGFSGIMGGSSGAFSGDNLLEIIGSRYAVEQTLLTSVEFNGKRETLADVYIKIGNLQKKWKKNNKNPELNNLSFPIGQPRETFSRIQDSVLFKIYQSISSPKSLSIARKDKKVSIVNVNFTSTNEKFSKLFVETLMDETYRFYSQTRTSQSRANIQMMQHTADSIKGLYETALYKGAGYSQANINQALSFAAVPRIKQETNAHLYGTVYTEVLKNLETLKLDLARETPLVQIIDVPRYPLHKEKFGKLKGIVFGGFLGGFFIIGYLFVKKFLKEIL